MNNSYWVLMVTIAGLFAIFRDGKWNWNVIPSSKVVNAVFWIGWSSSIAVFIVNMI